MWDYSVRVPRIADQYVIPQSPFADLKYFMFWILLNHEQALANVPQSTRWNENKERSRSRSRKQNHTKDQ